MSEQYTAWDGIEYSWPPPQGWAMGSDGRYWPEGQGPTGAEPPSPPSPSPGPPSPAPFAAPQSGSDQWSATVPPPGPAAPGAVPPPGAMPPNNYGSVPPPGPQAPGIYTYGATPAKSSKAGWWILGILLVIMTLGVGGCLLIANVLREGAAELGDTFEEFEDDITRRGDANEAIGIPSCTVVGGVPTALATVTNVRNSRSSYYVEIDFYETSTGTLLGSDNFSALDLEPGDSESSELSAEGANTEGGIRCETSFESIRIDD